MKHRLLRRGAAWAAALLLLAGSVQAQPTTGYVSLFIGHSFFRPVAQGLAFHAVTAGFLDHTQTVLGAGGANGAPQALWEDPVKRAEIQAVLDNGNVELFGMTFEPTYPTTEGYQNWIDYALAQNPDTRFFIGLPWADFPENYDTATYASTWINAHDNAWHDFIDEIRALYPGVVIFCIPYGRSAVELRNLFDAGNLPDVVALTSNTEESIFNDAKGHADGILLDLAELVWLNAIYGVDLNAYAHDPGYITDLKAIAQSIMDAHDAAHGPQPVPALLPVGLGVLAFACIATARRRLAGHRSA